MSSGQTELGHVTGRDGGDGSDWPRCGWIHPTVMACVPVAGAPVSLVTASGDISQLRVCVCVGVCGCVGVRWRQGD